MGTGVTGANKFNKLKLVMGFLYELNTGPHKSSNMITVFSKEWVKSNNILISCPGMLAPAILYTMSLAAWVCVSVTYYLPGLCVCWTQDEKNQVLTLNAWMEIVGIFLLLFLILLILFFMVLWQVKKNCSRKTTGNKLSNKKKKA